MSVGFDFYPKTPRSTRYKGEERAIVQSCCAAYQGFYDLLRIQMLGDTIPVWLLHTTVRVPYRSLKSPQIERLSGLL